MSRNNFKRIGDKIRESGFVLIVAAFLVAGMMITVITSVNDYYTSYMGVLQIPVNQTSDVPSAFELWLSGARQIAIAAMPQVITVIAGYIMLAFEPVSGNRREWSLWSAAAMTFAMAIAIDVITGYLYYIQPQYRGVPFSITIATADGKSAAMSALLMSGGIDTLFSEIGATVFWGLFFEIYPDAIRQWKRIFNGDSIDDLRPRGATGAGASARQTTGARPIISRSIQD